VSSPDSIAQGRLRVLIADDHRLFAESLQALLSDDERIDVIGIALDGREAVRLASSLVPDVVLMDVNMPVVDGLEATRLIKAAGGPTRVLLLTGTDLPITHAEAKEAGADAFLRKEQGAAELRETFVEVALLVSALGAQAPARSSRG
jgi:DNA-binding NarL/FixJ family response regulator